MNRYLFIGIAVVLIGVAGWIFLNKSTPVSPSSESVNTIQNTNSNSTGSNPSANTQENPKTYSTNNASVQAYLQGPSEVKANEEWKGTIVFPQEVAGVGMIGNPDIYWGDGKSDSDTSGTLWNFQGTDRVEISHLYSKSGTYNVLIQINGSAQAFVNGTVIIKKTITVK